MYKTIGIGGQLANGKDETANYLAERLNSLCKESWKRNAFANKVKEVFELSFNKTREWVEEWKRIEECPPGFIKNVRQCLIGIGDGFRQMKPDIWLELAFINQEKHQIISDCRYINECNHIRKNGGITILIWRDGYLNSLPNASEQEFVPFIRKCLETQSWGTGDIKWKPFEGEIPEDMNLPFDIFLRNERGINDLKRKVDTIVIPFIEKKWKTMF